MHQPPGIPGFGPGINVRLFLFKLFYLFSKAKQITLTFTNIKPGTITSHTQKVIGTYNGMQ